MVLDVLILLLFIIFDRLKAGSLALLFSLLLSLITLLSWFEAVLRIELLRTIDVADPRVGVEGWPEPADARGSDPARRFRSTATGSMHFRSYELKDCEDVVFGKGKAEGLMAALTDIFVLLLGLFHFQFCRFFFLKVVFSFVNVCTYFFIHWKLWENRWRYDTYSIFLLLFINTKSTCCKISFHFIFFFWLKLS